MCTKMSTNQTDEAVPLCQECKTQTASYQCPRCGFRSCSLSCCLAHKKRLDCSGKRDVTGFVPLARMSDGTVASDYFFLENVLGEVDRGKRLMKQVGGGGGNRGKSPKRPRMNIVEELEFDNEQARKSQHPIIKASGGSKQQKVSTKSTINRLLALASEGASETTSETASLLVTNKPDTSSATSHHEHHNPKQKALHQQAAQRRINLLFMPPGMVRHKENRSYYNRQTNQVHWTVEWIQYSATSGNSNKTRGSFQMVESLSLWDALAKHLKLLSRSDDVSCFDSLLIRKLPSPANQPVYQNVTKAKSLGEALSDQTIYEFPTIHVVPSSRLSQFPQSIEEVP